MNYKNHFKQRLLEAVSSPEEIQTHQRRRGTNPSLGQRIKRAVSTRLGTSAHY